MFLSYLREMGKKEQRVQITNEVVMPPGERASRHSTGLHKGE